MGELDMDLSLSPIRKVTAKQGRRADKSKSAFDDDTLNKAAFQSIKPKDLFAVEEPSSNEQPPLGRRRGIQGVWESDNNRAKSSLSRPKTAKNKGSIYDDDDDDVIPIIPDLEEVQEEDMVTKVAEAPNVNVNRVATYNELDNDLLKHAAFATLDEIDLRALTKSMAPESALKEPDQEWSWNTLFADIGGQLQEEWSSEMNGNEIEGETGNERPYTAFNKFPV